MSLFLMAVLGKQPAFPDAPTSANWTLVGICAHESAMKGPYPSAAPIEPVAIRSVTRPIPASIAP